MWGCAIVATYLSISTVTYSSAFFVSLNISSLGKIYHDLSYNIASANRHANVLNSSQLIALHGFPAEEHIVDSDGYKLTVFRIPGKGPSVLLVHGLIESSDDFLTLGNKSLAINLARRGYDVWLGNTRGNFYSRRHTTLSPEEPLFWDFSWHEIGVYDLPAIIDYMCDEAEVSKVGYVGHSQGTTAAYVLLSEKPEYNDKVSVVVSMSSVAWQGNSTSPVLTALAINWKKLEFATKLLDIHEILTRSQFSFCGTSSAVSLTCLTFIQYLIVGTDFNQIDNKQLNIQLSHFPSGSAVKQFLHFAQCIKNNSFRRYDYGLWDNLLKYGSMKPPSYMVENINTNMLIIYSENDFASNKKDIHQLTSKLPKEPEIYKVKLQSFNHFDYIWGKDADKLVYLKVIEFIKIYTF